MIITGTGNVGIGTTSPGARLDVLSSGQVSIFRSSNTNLYVTYRANGTDVGYIGNGIGTISGGSATDFGFQSINNTVFSTGGAGVERMRITSGGNVGIGTTSPLSRIQSQIESSSSALMLVNASGGGGAYVDLDFNTYTPYQAGYANPGATIRVIDDGAYSGNITFRTKGASIGAAQTERMRIEASTGNLGIGTSSPSYKLHVEGNTSGISIYASHDIAAFSDITVKKDVQKIENAIDKVKELNGYTYVRTDDETGTRRAGVIAQEVQKVLPEVVSANPDGTLNVAYSNMIALLIEGMKEQQATIEKLQSEINELKK
jgi:hypothetical protein